MNVQEWISEGKPWNVILYGDCMDLMAELKDKEFSLACVDPPYGIGFDGETSSMVLHPKSTKWKNPKLTGYIRKQWDREKPNQYYFNELQRISKNQIIWGGNYFTEFLKSTGGWIIWDKKKPQDWSMSQGEMAWQSITNSLKIFSRLWHGYSQENMKEKEIRIHPTQKPVALYRWILQKYAKPDDTIIDTHSGSASLACACHLEHFNFIAIEKDYDYWKASVERYENVAAQGSLF
jgi:site-specific DNA-methyltransferase (adenine-specific)